MLIWRYIGDVEQVSTAGEAFCLVMTSVAKESEGAALAQALVQARLAACVQLLPIRSFYIWQAKACDEPEHLLLIKTRNELYTALEAFIRERHAYEVPEILRLPITAGSAAYLAWVRAQTLDVEG